jgi:hypothetical protein
MPYMIFNSRVILSSYTGVPELADQTWGAFSLMVGNEGKKCLEKYSGCNSFLVMN